MVPDAHATDDEIAVFDQEEEASFDTESPVASHDHAEVSPLYSHAGHYHPPGYFPERLKRTVNAHPWMGIVPFVMLVMLSIVTTQFWGKGSHKSLLAVKRAAWGKVSAVISGIVLIIAFSVGISNALTYSSVKDAVVSFMGEGKKIYQTKIDITPDVKQKLKNELKWEPETSSIKIFYSKSTDGKPDAYAFVLSDRLPQCGGLHKYCIKVSSNGQVEGVKILELTCDRSYSINNKAFLNQFKSFNSANADKKKYDILSGATLSTDLTHNIVRRALMLFELVKGRSNA
jgi:hypothetical protein